MNDRIKELIERATINISDEDHAPIEFFHKEKFAELIIKETVQVVRAGIEYGNGMEDAVYNYFGVEL